MSTYDNTDVQEIDAGIDNQAVAWNLTGRATGTTYYYRTAASNDRGTSRGSIKASSPARRPRSRRCRSRSVGASTATLRGAVTPNGLATTAWFEYGTELDVVDLLQHVVPERRVRHHGAGGHRRAVRAFRRDEVLLPGRRPERDRNDEGKHPELLLSLPAHGHDFGGHVDRREHRQAERHGHPQRAGDHRLVRIRHELDAVVLFHHVVPKRRIRHREPVDPANLTGLSLGTRYYFRIAATNSAGTQKGSIRYLTTPASSSAPISTSLEPERIATGAICNGKVNPNGIESTAWIEWGTDPELSSYTASSSQSIGSGTSNRYLSEPLTYLTTGTTYYCRVAGQNAKGTTRGDITSFTVIDGTWTINDDFTSNDMAEYAITGTGSITHNSGTGKAVVTAGSGETLTITKNCRDGGIGTGTFSMEFKPTAENGSGANLTIRLADTSLTYFEFSADDGSFRKYRKGVLVDSVQLPATYSVGTTYTIKITVGQLVDTVEAFGGRASMDANDELNPWNAIVITATELNATYDNIRVTKEQ